MNLYFNTLANGHLLADTSKGKSLFRKASEDIIWEDIISED